jgi:peptidoglycan lytic transglycosylase G
MPRVAGRSVSTRTTEPPSSGTRRRLLAFVVLLALLGAVGWFAVSLVRDGMNDTAPPTQDTSRLFPPTQVLGIIFPEGFTREQMAERIVAVNKIAKRERHVEPRISKDAYLRLTDNSKLPGRFAHDGKRRSLEGILFPAKYDFTARTSTKQLIAKQLQAFHENWSQVDLRYAKSKNLTPYDVLIIASMIEKEVAAPEERIKVSSVIYNRLKAGMPLEIDATVRYGLGIPPTESLHQSQLDDPNPYNTRKHTGLPPGPIANPGLASMQAAAHPKKTDFLYFVRKPDKRHHYFTDNLADFNKYQSEHGY